MKDSTLKRYWAVRKAARLVTSKLGSKDKLPLVIHVVLRDCKLHDVPVGLSDLPRNRPSRTNYVHVDYLAQVRGRTMRR
jgi:hypothetical protein